MVVRCRLADGGGGGMVGVDDICEAGIDTFRNSDRVDDGDEKHPEEALCVGDRVEKE